MKQNSLVILFTVVFFSIAMGYLESAVVVYLREIYYPEGFAFPLKLMSERVMITEIFRELATLVMLAGIGFIAGRSWLERFGMFLLAFGIWDIFYYVFLYVLLGWPESLFSWDILFLIPTTWVGPVLAPCINALSMIIFGALIWYYQSADKLRPVKLISWLLLAPGSLIVIWAYIQDYVNYLQQEFSLSAIFFPTNPGDLMEYSLQYVPAEFNWWIFWIGQLLIITGIGLWYFSHKGTQRDSQRTQKKAKNHNR